MMVVVGVVMVVSERVKGVEVVTWPNKRPSMSPEECGTGDLDLVYSGRHGVMEGTFF